VGADAARPAAVPGLVLSDPRGPGITRARGRAGFSYCGPSSVAVTDAQTLQRIGALAIPPARAKVWISADPLGHIQATGVDSRGRTQYRYHQLWREQRDAQKFAHMLRFAQALPALRSTTIRDLGHRSLDRSRVIAAAVRLIDIGLFRIGGERYAELDHHYGAATLEKRHVSLAAGSITFDYVAKEGKRRAITITDQAVWPTISALAGSGSGADALFRWREGGAWRSLHSHDVSSYIARAPAGISRPRSSAPGTPAC
jgi:DNA topoisomerase IB